MSPKLKKTVRRVRKMPLKPERKGKTVTAKGKGDTKAVAAPARKQAWGGVIPKDNSGREGAQTADFCNKVAEIYGVPSLGVNAMGGNPYLNKDGRLFLLYDLCKGSDAVESISTEFLQMSLTPDQASIARVTIKLANGLTVNATGEASIKSVKLAAVQNTLNMMAETRATNRAIWKIVAQRVWDRVAENIATLSEEDKKRVVNAGAVSAEEMDRPAPKVTDDETIIEGLKAKVDAMDDLKTLYESRDKLTASKLSPTVKTPVLEYLEKKLAALNAMADLATVEKETPQQ